MPENSEISPEERKKLELTHSIQSNSRMLPDEQVQDIYNRYGLVYNVPSTDEYKLCTLLAAAERLLEDKLHHK